MATLISATAVEFLIWTIDSDVIMQSCLNKYGNKIFITDFNAQICLAIKLNIEENHLLFIEKSY